MEVLFAVLSAAANALGSVLQRRGAARAPDRDSMRLRLIVDLLRQPVWAAGIVSMIMGVMLQALALSSGPLALVAPVIIIELPFTLLLAAVIFHARLDRRSAAAILVTTVSLSALLLIARPSGGRPHGVPALSWVLATLATAAAVAVLVLAGRRFDGAARAALLATAGGVGHGLSATLMKATAALAAHGVAAIFTSWKLYGMIAAGGFSLYLFQNALQAGSVVAAQPGVTITDPMVSVIFGLVLFGERVHAGLLILPEVVCAAVLATGIIFLSRSPLLHDDHVDDDDRSRDSETAARPRASPPAVADG